MKELKKFGALSNMVRVKILNSSLTTGAGLTGLAYNTSGLVIDLIADNSPTAYHYKSAATATIEDITTLGTFAAPTAANCRFKEVDATNFPGLYEMQFLDGCFDDASATKMIGEVKGPTNCTPTTFEIQMSSVPADVTHLLGTAWLTPAVAGTPDVTVLGAVLTKLGVLDSGTAAAIANGTITLRSGHGISGLASALVILTGGTAAIGKSRIITYSGSGDVFNVDPAWNAVGETLPSGTITYVVMPAPPAPAATNIPAVNVTQLGGVAQSATDLKDLADTGYDPSTHKVAGVVLADAATTVTGGATSAEIAALDAVVDTVKVDTAAITAKTTNLPSDPADQLLVIAATDAITSAIAALNNLSSTQAQAAAAAALTAGAAALAAAVAAKIPTSVS